MCPQTLDYYSNGEPREYSTSVDDLGPALWPGRTLKEPRGWVMPPLKDKKMKIGVPVKVGFREFFKIDWDPRTGIPTYSGFSYDVFIAVLDALDFYLPYELVPFMNASRQSAGTYDELLYQIKLQVIYTSSPRFEPNAQYISQLVKGKSRQIYGSNVPTI